MTTTAAVALTRRVRSYTVFQAARSNAQEEIERMCENNQIAGTEQRTNGMGIHDRQGDPLFPLMPLVIEALRNKVNERRALESREASDQDEYTDLIESICGASDDSQPVEQYDGGLGVTRPFVDTHQAAVGQIQWNANLASVFTNPGNVNGQRWCSGTLITDDLFLTAGHCFDQTGGGWERPRINGTSNIISSADIATNMHVNFNFQVDAGGAQRIEQSFPIVGLLEYRLGSLDFAVVRLGGNPGASFGRALVSTSDASGGEMLCLIGHPAGLPKRIEAGPALAPSGAQIRYDDIDTLGGNSGSGVLRASDGKLVGVHTNGGCAASSPNGVNANFGMRIAALIAASPILRGLTAPSLITTPARDIAVTVRGSDVAETSFARDVFTGLGSDAGTSLGLDVGTRKGLDDLKSPAFDKSPITDLKHPAFDAPGGIDPLGPVVNPAVGGARPFVLATPHHAPIPNGGDGRSEQLAAALNELGSTLVQQQGELQALGARYQEILVEYQSYLAGQG